MDADRPEPTAAHQAKGRSPIAERFLKALAEFLADREVADAKERPKPALRCIQGGKEG